MYDIPSIIRFNDKFNKIINHNIYWLNLNEEISSHSQYGCSYLEYSYEISIVNI
jgi:hypothetical protein